ncbi:MAG: TetR/AcrR family transcriptional regulator [Hoeflea sp.]|nr:TetR/AcrR family transcriptional regulator [Hoeflea sp.]
MANTLTRTDWIKAGFRLLGQSGPKAVRVDVLCRELGVTKGSFYWHFTDLAALRAAMAAQWRRDATGDVIAAMTSSELTPRDLLIRLFEHVLSRPERDQGGSVTEAAMRQWAGGDTAVEAGVRTADAERLAFLTLHLRGAGLSGPEARSRAAFLSATLIGLEQLAGEPALPRLDVAGFIDAMLTPARV